MRSNQVKPYEFSNLPIPIGMGSFLRHIELSMNQLDLVVTATGNDMYRFGFNGKEKDDEVKGEGNQQDYGARIYDPRLGRFLSVDPLTSEYPELTPYQFASNTPIQAIDLDGLEAYIHGSDAQKTVMEIQKKTSLKLVYDVGTCQLTAFGIPKTKIDEELLNITISQKIETHLYVTEFTEFEAKDGRVYPIKVGGFDGSEIVNKESVSQSQSESDIMSSSYSNDVKVDTKIVTTQYFNYNQSEKVQKGGLSDIGTDALHELMESFEAGKLYPGVSYTKEAQEAAHANALYYDNKCKDLYPTTIVTPHGQEQGVCNGTGDGKTVELPNDNPLP